MRTTISIALLLMTSGAASADVLSFRDRPLSDPKAKAAWSDYLSVQPLSGQPGGESSTIAAVVRDGTTEWTVMQIHDRGWCGMNTCSTRVFRDGELWLSADLCSRGADDAGTAWNLDPKSRTLSACGEKHRLAPNDIEPTRLANGTFMPMPGWSTAIVKRNASATNKPAVTKASAPPATAEVLGEPFDHNGSEMTIAHSDGLIVYAKPKKSIQDSVKPGTVLFRGGLENPDHVAGTAYTFKKGCAPAPYQVSGRFAGGQLSGTLTLSGKAPVRSKTGCEVTSYSSTSGNAKLTFEYIAPPEM